MKPPTASQEARAAQTIRERQLTIEEWLVSQPVAGRGETCTAEDMPRLSAQCLRVYAVLSDLAVHTLRDISAATGDPEASVSVRIRQIRGYLHVGDKGDILAKKAPGRRGVWSYSMKLNRYFGGA